MRGYLGQPRPQRVGAGTTLHSCAGVPPGVNSVRDGGRNSSKNHIKNDKVTDGGNQRMHTLSPPPGLQRARRSALVSLAMGDGEESGKAKKEKKVRARCFARSLSLSARSLCTLSLSVRWQSEPPCYA